MLQRLDRVHAPAEKFYLAHTSFRQPPRQRQFHVGDNIFRGMSLVHVCDLSCLSPSPASNRGKYERPDAIGPSFSLLHIDMIRQDGWRIDAGCPEYRDCAEERLDEIVSDVDTKVARKQTALR